MGHPDWSPSTAGGPEDIVRVVVVGVGPTVLIPAVAGRVIVLYTLIVENRAGVAGHGDLREDTGAGVLVRRLHGVGAPADGTMTVNYFGLPLGVGNRVSAEGWNSAVWAVVYRYANAA